MKLPEPTTLSEKIERRLKSHSFWRFYQFGANGKTETQEEKRTRVLSGPMKREGYSMMERIFFNRLAPAVHFLRFFIVALFMTCFILVCVYAPRHLAAEVHPAA